MLVTTAIVGESSRKDPSLSSASRTIYSPFPSRALLPMVFNRPPTTTVGSNPARSRIVAIMDVVVVFPWVPAMAMLYFSRASSASISALGITGIFRRSAARISGLSRRTADDVTTTCAAPIFSAACV
jgi:hypothetical protein